MALEDDILTELRRHEPSDAVAGRYLAEKLDRPRQDVLDASRQLEAKSRLSGTDYIVIITNQRADRSVEPPDEFYVHLSDA